MSLGMSSNHFLGQRACDCERRGVGLIMVSSGAVMFGLSGCIALRHRMNTTIVLARRPINAAVVALIQARWCTASRCAERRVVFWHLTTPVQARFPIDAGGVGFIMACFSAAMHGEVSWCVAMSALASCGSSWNQARVGTVPDQRRRLGMHHGMVRRVDVGHGPV